MKVQEILNQLYPKVSKPYQPLTPPKPKKVPKPQQDKTVLQSKVFVFPMFGSLNVGLN